MYLPPGSHFTENRLHKMEYALDPLDNVTGLNKKNDNFTEACDLELESCILHPGPGPLVYLGCAS